MTPAERVARSRAFKAGAARRTADIVARNERITGACAEGEVEFLSVEFEMCVAREISSRPLHGVPSTYRTELQNITAIIAEKIRNDDLFKTYRTPRVTFLSVGDQIEIRRKLADPETDADLAYELAERLRRHAEYRGSR